MIKKHYACVLVIVATAILAAGCADAPSDPETQAKLAANLAPVEAVQPGDNQLDCNGLSTQISQMNWDISALNLQVNQAQDTHTTSFVLGALAHLDGALATTESQAVFAHVEGAAAHVGAAVSSAQGMSKAAILGTYQARYENLVDLFNSKNCRPTD